jgi:hypothetical protein
MAGVEPAALSLRATTASGGAKSRSDVLTGIIGARRPWRVLMISALSIPCR